MITAFIPIVWDLSSIKTGIISFRIRLDYLLHFTVYFLICVYYIFEQWKGLNLFNSNYLIKFILLSILLATGTEVVQLWVPQRSFNPWDMVANMVGVSVGIGTVRMAQRIKA
jgi:VanZ family protein